MVLRAPRFSPSLPLLSYNGFLLLIELNLSSSLLHIVLYLHNNNPTWLVSCIFQVSLGSSDHQFRNNLLCIKQNLTWANVFCLSLRQGSGMNSQTLITFETIYIFRKKTEEVFILNCISTINLRLSLGLTMTFARPCSRLYLTIKFCCAYELRFLRI